MQSWTDTEDAFGACTHIHKFATRVSLIVLRHNQKRVTSSAPEHSLRGSTIQESCISARMQIGVSTRSWDRSTSTTDGINVNNRLIILTICYFVHLTIKNNSYFSFILYNPKTHIIQNVVGVFYNTQQLFRLREVVLKNPHHWLFFVLGRFKNVFTWLANSLLGMCLRRIIFQIFNFRSSSINVNRTRLPSPSKRSIWASIRPSDNPNKFAASLWNRKSYLAPWSSIMYCCRLYTSVRNLSITTICKY